MKLKRLITAVCTVTLAAVLLAGVQRVLKLNTGHRGTDCIQGFYELDENTLDVLFVGASTMFCTADPLCIYENSGIRSYDLGSSSQPVKASYMLIEEAFKTQKPKVVAMEMVSIVRDFDGDDRSVCDYVFADMPTSCNKLKHMYDMFDGDIKAMLPYVFPIIEYKDRWTELEKLDFTGTECNYSMGAYTPALISDNPPDFSGYETETEGDISEENRETMHRIKALCEKHGSQLLLFKAPNGGFNRSEVEKIESLAEELGADFINFFDLMEELDIDVTKDFRDNTHFNRYGSEKASKYLANYLTAHCEFGEASEGAGRRWEASLALRERDRRQEALAACDNLAEYMSLLNADNYTVIYNISGDGEDARAFAAALAAAAGIDADELSGGGALVLDGKGCETVRPGETRYLDLGSSTVRLTGYTITLDGEVKDPEGSGITVLVYDRQLGRIADVAGFNCAGSRRNNN